MTSRALRTCIASAAWLGSSIAVSVCSAAEDADVRGPLSPRQSLAEFVVEPGLTIELVAHEPNVIDPVAIRFDEDGRLWVVEMRDYPTAIPGGPRSRISILDDRDHDGFFESAAVFADDLPYATGIQPWCGGVFATLAGKIEYLKDGDGDGRADVAETWFTGFAEQNTQLRASHPRLALNNHIYVANGLRGGRIVGTRVPNASPVSIAGMDFRFDPRTGFGQAVSGVGQFGLAFDDFGNRFVCTNRNPAMHVVLEDHDLRKNRLFAVPTVVHNVAKAAHESRLFPIAESWTTSNLHAGQFTAACGLVIYRGDALPRDCRGNLFVCEPTGHLVHRERVRPLGVTFESSPARPGSEFLASRDAWCCPVNLDVGPDGALYIVDMYRAVIEHPEFMPSELRERLDLRAGDDRGRIYRIVPQGFRRPEPPRLSTASTDALVDCLSRPNAWWRETAARLLLERTDRSAIPKLREVARHAPSALARVHAMWLLEALGGLNEDTLRELLHVDDPRVVEQAIVAGESHVVRSQALQHRVACLTGHEDPRVRFRALLAAMSPPPAPQRPTDRWLLHAMLIATGNQGGTVLQRMLQSPRALDANVADPNEFISDLASLAAESTEEKQWTAAIIALLADERFRYAGMASALSTLTRRGLTIGEVRSKLPAGRRSDFDDLISAACREAADDDQPDRVRQAAVDLLAASGRGTDVCSRLALESPAQPIRLRAIAALARHSDLKPWRRLIDGYDRESPATQSAILQGVFADPQRMALLLDEIAAGRFSPSHLDPQRTTALLHHADATIQQRAQALLADAVPQERQAALAEYQIVLELEGDARRGRDVFRQQCATCHRIGDVGVNVAADISDSREKSPAQLLADIIQPNRAIDANYFSYTAITTDGVVHTGILASETSTSVTLRGPGAKDVTLRRDHLDDLRSDGVSLMPEGLERLIPPRDMADLISYIKNWRYLDDSPIRAQNRP